MFAQLLLFSKMIELKEDEYLYKQGDSSQVFYFVMTGNLQLLYKKDDEFKYSKGIDESSFFG